MKHVYLDQNKWIDLSKAYHGRGDGKPFTTALATVERAAADGTAAFPLSTTHYMETSLAPHAGSRSRLAEVMERTSRFATIADQQIVVPHELDLAIARRFGGPQPDQLELFGRGAAHAFREPRYQGLDAIILRGAFMTEEARKAHAQIDERFKQARSAQQQMFRERGLGTGGKLHDAVIGRTVADIIDPLIKALGRAGVSLDEFFSKVGADLESFLIELPSRRVMFELQRAQDAGAAPYKVGDLRDLGALAVAVAYCDVVITENQWTDVVQKAKLDKAFGTLVSSDVRDLALILA